MFRLQMQVLFNVQTTLFRYNPALTAVSYLHPATILQRMFTASLTVFPGDP